MPRFMQVFIRRNIFSAFSSITVSASYTLSGLLLPTRGSKYFPFWSIVAHFDAGSRILPYTSRRTIPWRSYRIFEACLTLARNWSRPSAENTGSRTHAASRFVSPSHAGSPSRYLMTCVFATAPPTYGARAGIRGVPSLNDCLSRSRYPGFPSSYFDRGPMFSTTCLMMVRLPLEFVPRWHLASFRYFVPLLFAASMCIASPAYGIYAITIKLYHRRGGRARGNVDFIGNYLCVPRRPCKGKC